MSLKYATGYVLMDCLIWVFLLGRNDTYKGRSKRCDDGTNPAHHGGESEEIVPVFGRVQLSRVHVHGSHYHRDAELADQINSQSHGIQGWKTKMTLSFTETTCLP